MGKKVWTTANVPGAELLQKTLNKMSEEGLSIFQIFEHGLAPVQTSPIQGGQVQVVPLFTIVAFRIDA